MALSSVLLRMGRGDLCHNRCVGSLLADSMQDVGATKPDAWGARYRLCTLSAYSDFRIYHNKRGGRDCRAGGRVLWGDVHNVNIPPNRMHI